MSSAQRVIPAASADSTVAARSAIRSAGTSSTLAGADVSTTRASGREKSVACSGSTATSRRSGESISSHFVPGRHQQQTIGNTAQHPRHGARRLRRRRVELDVAVERHPGGALPGRESLAQLSGRTPPAWPARWSPPGRAPEPWRPLRPSRTGPRCCRPRRRTPRGPRHRTGPVRPGRRRPAARLSAHPARYPGPLAVAPDPAAQSRTNSRAANCSSVMVVGHLNSSVDGNGAA